MSAGWHRKIAEIGFQHGRDLQGKIAHVALHPHASGRGQKENVRSRAADVPWKKQKDRPKEMANVL